MKILIKQQVFILSFTKEKCLVQFRLPYLLDFGVVKRLPANTLHAASSLDLYSDHSPVTITTHSRIIPQPSPPTLSSKYTNWETFRTLIRERLPLYVPLKAEREIEVYVHQFVQIIQQAAWDSTPNPRKSPNLDDCAPLTKQKILEKLQLRKRWQQSRSPQQKAKLNQTVQELKQLLNDQKQKAIQTYLKSLSATEVTDYSIWKASKKLKQPQTPIPPLRELKRENGRRAMRKRQTYWQTTLQMSLNRILPRCPKNKNGKSHVSSKLLAGWKPESRNLKSLK
jgi:hypothetical protein